VLLGAIAAATSRVRIQTGVCVLSILDPVRVAEDYATIDQLSRGRLELVIGKGNEARQLPLFGVEPGQQWDQLAEKYELLRRLWREENVTWTGNFRAPLRDATTLPRPFAGAPRVWHGSATTQTSAALAAKWGDPLFSANAIQPRDNYKVLIDHYRAEYDRHGHDPRYAYVAAGAGFLFLADTTQQAKQHYGPIYSKMVEFFNKPGNHTPGNEMTFRDIDHAVAEGPVLVGSPQQIIDKIGSATTCNPSACPPCCRMSSNSRCSNASPPKSSPWSGGKHRPPCGPTRTPTADAPPSPAARSPTLPPSSTPRPPITSLPTSERHTSR